jgi:hypothetical protein
MYHARQLNTSRITGTFEFPRLLARTFVTNIEDTLIVIGGRR